MRREIQIGKIFSIVQGKKISPIYPDMMYIMSAILYYLEYRVLSLSISNAGGDLQAMVFRKLSPKQGKFICVCAASAVRGAVVVALLLLFANSCCRYVLCCYSVSSIVSTRGKKTPKRR